MKSRILALFAFLACAFSAAAVNDTVVFTAQGYTHQQAVTSYTGTEFEITFSQGTNNLNVPIYYKNSTSDAIRIYAFNTFTVASLSNSNITGILLTFEEKNETNVITASVGSYTDNQKSGSVYTGTWAGNAASVTFSVAGPNGNRRLKKMVVTVEGGGSQGAIDPTLSFSNGKVIVGKTLDLSSLFTSNSQGAVTYSITAGTDYAALSGSVLTGVAEGSVSVKASQAAVEGVWNASEATATVEVKPAPAGWAVTYTSNVTLSTTGGTSASAAKVVIGGEEYDAIKAGVSGTAGAVKIDVPAGTHTLHVHIAGWNGESGVVSVSVLDLTGATVTPNSLTLDGAAGGNSPFTISGNPGETEYFALALTGITEEATIQFKATTGKRFVIYGVNAITGNVGPNDKIDPTASFTDGAVTIGQTLDLADLFTSTSQGTVTYSITAGSDYATISGSVLTGVAEGSVTVKAAQAEAGQYNAIEKTATIVVSAAPVISDYATCYTSNVTLATTGGTKAYEADVVISDGTYDAIKCGTSSAAGAMKITVPAGTHTLHFHAAAWSGENVTLTLSGATATPSTFSLTADSGVSGSGSTYTLSNNPAQKAYFSTALSGIAEATTLTFTATAGKRFVIFGVNAVVSAATALDELQGNGTQSTKCLRNGILYIIRDGRTYNAQGMLVE